MKPHLPIAILATLLSAFSFSSVQAFEIPDDYEQVDIWAPGYLDDYVSNTEENKYAFLLYSDVSFTPTSNPGWTDSTPLVSGGNLIFTTAESYDPIALSFIDGESNIFSTRSLIFDTLSSLVISGHTGRSLGLSIGYQLCIRNVTNSTHTPETAAIVFSGNESTAYLGANLDGGIISSRSTDALIEFSDNGSILFSDNSLTGETSFGSPSGGAIYSSSIFNINNNEDITFSKNTCSSTNNYTTAISCGGAICLSEVITITANRDITFSGNSNSSNSTTPNSTPSTSYTTVAKSYGGAISSSSAININNNKNIEFSENFCYSYAHSALTTYTSSSAAYGGAIHSTAALNINNNADVLFSGNFTHSKAYSYESYTTISYGGAIYSTGSISIVGNDKVTFEKNYERKGNTYLLRSIYMAPDSSGDNLVLGAKTGGHITFYDSVFMGNYTGSTVSFNADYQDADGVTQKAGGDIIFSGKFTAEHLEAVKNSAATAAEVTNSQTSEINNHINLYGGSLQVVDGAKLNGRGLTVAEGSGAKLLLRDGSMSHGSYNFTFNNGTTLELQGLNTITAAKLSLGSDSALTVTVGEEHQNTAALTLGGTDLETSKLTVNLNRTDGLTSGVYKIISQASASDFTTSSAWTAANVCVNGSGGASQAAFEDLVWEGGTLYYKVGRTTWGNASGDGLWNSTSDNWTMNDRSYTYLDGMDVSFTDTAAGTVNLDGDIAAADILVNNSEGNDYTFSTANGGKLTGTGGITKQGAGALTIATANEHTGDTSLEGGTLNLHHSTALGATATGDAALTTAAGTSMNIAANSHLVLAGSNSMAGEVAVEAGSTLEMKGSGYAASTSTVNGTLAFTGTAASTNAAGSLSGSGTVRVTDSQVSFASQSSFTGNLAVKGKGSSLNVASGSYTGAGKVSISGGTLTFGASADLTLNSGGSLSMAALGDAPAALTARNINVKSGSTLEAMLELEASVSLSAEEVGLGNAPAALNETTGGILNCTRLTMNVDSTLSLDNAHFDMNGGTLTLAVPKNATSKIELVLAPDAVYAASTQVLLFSNLGTINFIYDGVTADVSQGSTYSLNAADYFSGKGITANTELVFDGGRNVLYLQGMEMVPEPTTATLSLLALAALAARRRRK